MNSLGLPRSGRQHAKAVLISAACRRVILKCHLRKSAAHAYRIADRGIGLLLFLSIGLSSMSNPLDIVKNEQSKIGSGIETGNNCSLKQFCASDKCRSVKTN
jgi:hypothetical protein